MAIQPNSCAMREHMTQLVVSPKVQGCEPAKAPVETLRQRGSSQSALSGKPMWLATSHRRGFISQVTRQGHAGHRALRVCVLATDDGIEMTQQEQQRRTALFDWHVANGGRMVDFAGWELPVFYETGSIAEHHAPVRRSGCSTSITWARSKWPDRMPSRWSTRSSPPISASWQSGLPSTACCAEKTGE